MNAISLNSNFIHLPFGKKQSATVSRLGNTRFWIHRRHYNWRFGIYITKGSIQISLFSLTLNYSRKN